jgi:hypothetical protein
MGKINGSNTFPPILLGTLASSGGRKSSDKLHLVRQNVAKPGLKQTNDHIAATCHSARADRTGDSFVCIIQDLPINKS